MVDQVQRCTPAPAAPQLAHVGPVAEVVQVVDQGGPVPVQQVGEALGALEVGQVVVRRPALEEEVVLPPVDARRGVEHRACVEAGEDDLIGQVDWAREEGVNAKALGLLDPNNWSILR